DAAWRLSKKDQAVASWQRAHEILLEVPQDRRTPDQLALIDSIPAKIQTAEQGLQPDLASALTDN
ncbi:MAG: hypothetical protein IID34_18260, partial [Planctomycetes bacterium]|nr:hypothetical protein [Planctomycetota bacterium]